MTLKGTTIGPYEIVEELGRGGMGRVYKAFEPELRRFVALKMMSESLASDAKVVERFLREARAMAQLTDPHIVQVYTVGTHEEQPYFAMEFVEGETLAAKIRREGKLPLASAFEIVTQVARGLATAHEKGVIHRDIKPSNILLSKRGLVKVADFGIAMWGEESAARLTRTGQSIGTPGYMSPELCLGQPITVRSDIFSLGVVLFEMLTGNLPVREESPFKMMQQIINLELPDLQAICPELDPLAEGILRRMVARDPESRYPSCQVLLSDLLHHPVLRGAGVGGVPLASGIAWTQGAEGLGTAAGAVASAGGASAAEWRSEAAALRSNEPRPPLPASGGIRDLAAEAAREEQAPAGRDQANAMPGSAAAAVAVAHRGSGKSGYRRFLCAVIVLAGVLPAAVALAVLFSREDLFASSTHDEQEADESVEDGSEEKGFLARIWPGAGKDERDAKAKQLGETFTPTMAMGASAILDPSNPGSAPKLVGHAEMRITAAPKPQPTRTRTMRPMRTVAILVIGDEGLAAPFVQGFKSAAQQESIKVVDAMQLAQLGGLLDP